MAGLHIREVGCREGFQILSDIYPTDQKLQLIELLVAAGLRDLEVCSFVRPDVVPQMADAEAIAAGISPRAGVTYTGLYLNIPGFKRAVGAAGCLSTRGWIPIAASDQFLKRNANTTFEQILLALPRWEDAFTEAGIPVHGLMISACFGTNDGGAIPNDVVVTRVLQVLQGLQQTPRELCVADTMGWGTPEAVRQLVRTLRKETGIEVSLHLHNTRGMGVVNLYAGLEEGVTTIESSIGGLGGCPFAPGASGNVATEEVVLLASSMGIETSVSLEGLASALSYLDSTMGISAPSALAKVWRTAGVR
jgi:hydroxymethylglutaryl-CoA lyase